MTEIHSSAPGKAVLSGEYVVLDGAPAIAVALSCRVTVSISSTAQRYHQITAPGLTADSWQFTDDGKGELLWQNDEAADLFRLFACVWRRVRPETSRALSVRIDSSQFRNRQDAAKLGLGSSAAVASSLTGALQQLSASSRNDPADTMLLAKAAHLEFQGGHGSGVDIATSVSGGVIKYAIDAPAKAIASDWPEGLLCRFLWSGKSAVTTDYLKKYVGGRRTPGGDQSRLALREKAVDISSKWSVAPVAQLLQSFADYTDSLRQFSNEYQLDVFASGHEELSALAPSCGIVYKPCGAGGGDVGVALAQDAASLSAFCDQAQGQGFTALDVLPDWRGVVVETESKE